MNFFANELQGDTHICLTVYGITDIGECCQNQICRTILGTRSLERFPLDFEVYPNPSKEQVTLNFEEMKAEDSIEYIIYDIYGRKVFSRTTKNTSEVIDNSSWSSGIYMCVAKSGNYRNCETNY